MPFEVLKASHSALSHPNFGEDSPTKIDYRTLLSSLEDLRF